MTNRSLLIVLLLATIVSAGRTSSCCKRKCPERGQRGPPGRAGPPGPCPALSVNATTSQTCPGGSLALTCNNRTTTTCLPPSHGNSPTVNDDHLYVETRFVDPVHGNDSFVGDNIEQPKLTLQSAVNNITDASATKPYIIVLFTGTAARADTGIVWKPSVSLQGAGRDSSLIQANFSYTASGTDPPGATFSISDVGFVNASVSFILDLTLDTTQQVTIEEVEFNVFTWNFDGATPLTGHGAPPPTTQLIIRDATFQALTLPSFSEVLLRRLTFALAIA